MKILILLATLYLVDARYYHNYDDDTDQQQMSKVIELLQNISNKLDRPLPQTVYVPYPIVLHGNPTGDRGISSMEEDTAHNYAKPESGSLYKRNNPAPIKLLSRFQEDSTKYWGVKEKDNIPREQMKDADLKNYNSLFYFDKNGGSNEEDLAALASEDTTVLAKTALEDDLIKAPFGETDLHYDDSVIPINLDPFKLLELSAPPDDHGSRQAGLDLYSEASRLIETRQEDIFSNDGKSGTEPLYNCNNPSPNDNGEGDSAAEEEGIVSKTSLEDNKTQDEVENDDSMIPITSDPFTPLELTTTPTVDHGSSQAADLKSEESRKVEAEGSKQVEISEELSRDCALAILTCCLQEESEVGSCFATFNCTEIFAPGITCLKHVTSNTFQLFKEHIPKYLKLV